MQNVIKNTKRAVGAFSRKARNLVGVGSALALASPAAFAQVASTLGESATTELTAAQTTIIGLLTILVAIAIGFVVYALIKKAR